MKKFVNVAVDIETLSKRSTAAIIGIAAKTFDLEGCNHNAPSEFKVAIDATSCAMKGFDIDPATVDWWSRKPDEVQRQFEYPLPINVALFSFTTYVKDAMKLNDADIVRIWCQGTDFDIAILRNAFVVVNKDREERTIPWKYCDVRDARTFVCEGIRLLYPDLEDTYSVIPPMEGWKQHNAMSDVDNLIHNVRWVDKKLHDLILRRYTERV